MWSAKPTLIPITDENRKDVTYFRTHDPAVWIGDAEQIGRYKALYGVDLFQGSYVEENIEQSCVGGTVNKNGVSSKRETFEVDDVPDVRLKDGALPTPGMPPWATSIIEAIEDAKQDILNALKSAGTTKYVDPPADKFLELYTVTGAQILTDPNSGKKYGNVILGPGKENTGNNVSVAVLDGSLGLTATTTALTDSMLLVRIYGKDIVGCKLRVHNRMGGTDFFQDLAVEYQGAL